MLSIAVMAHRARAGFVSELAAQLPDAHLAWDRGEGVWETGRRALLAHGDTDWHLVLQDDAILCRDFIRRVWAALVLAPEDVGCVSLWLSEEVAGTLEPLREPGWLDAPGPWGGVAIAVRTRDIPDLIEWADGETVDSYDKRISRYYEVRSKPCRYTLPSLVDHRPLTENPSLVGRQVDSRAFWFEP